jgi:hypothetical protein
MVATADSSSALGGGRSAPSVAGSGVFMWSPPSGCRLAGASAGAGSRRRDERVA